MPFKTGFNPVELRNTEVFKPVKLGAHELKHKVVLAPLTRFRCYDNVPQAKLMADYYSQRATEGGLLITEGVFISPEASGYNPAPGIWTEEMVEKWTEIIASVKKTKAVLFLQLWNLGRQSSPATLAAKGLPFVSASDVYMDEATEKEAKESGNLLRGLTVDEIKEHIAAYVQAAKNAIKAGADGIEIHNGNGYLLNQFIDPKSNKRTDQYGGSIENRARFTLEVIDAIAEAIGAEKVAIRFSPFGTFGNMSGAEDPTLLATYAYIYGELEKRKIAGKEIAHIHIVEPRATSFFLEIEDVVNKASNDVIYSIWSGTVIKAGSYALNPEAAIEDAKKPRTLLAYGRFFISNPDLVDRLAKGLPLNSYFRETFYGETGHGYTDYPTYEEALKDPKFLEEEVNDSGEWSYTAAAKR